MTASETAIDKEAYLASIEDSGARLFAAARQGLEPPVPSCPGWNVAALVAHIGGVHYGWAEQTAERRTEPPQFRPDVFERLPGLLPWVVAVFDQGEYPGPPPDGLIEWAEGATRRLIDVLRETDLETPVWHWSGDHRMLSTLRMQRFETALHRWDAQLAHREPDSIDVETAAPGIDHALDVMLPARRQWKEPVTGKGESFHFHRTDGEGEWFVRFDGPDVEVRRGHVKADVAARGTAEELFLFLWGRYPAEKLDVAGDLDLLKRWQEFDPPG